MSSSSCLARGYAVESLCERNGAAPISSAATSASMAFRFGLAKMNEAGGPRLDYLEVLALRAAQGPEPVSRCSASWRPTGSWKRADPDRSGQLWMPGRSSGRPVGGGGRSGGRRSAMPGSARRAGDAGDLDGASPLGMRAGGAPQRALAGMEECGAGLVGHAARGDDRAELGEPNSRRCPKVARHRTALGPPRTPGPAQAVAS